MSAGGAFGGSRGLQPRAPEKGVFPLDHFGECKQVCSETLHCMHMHHMQLTMKLTCATTQVSQNYLACLKENAGDASKCRELSKLYLQCRMDRYEQLPSACQTPTPPSNVHDVKGTLNNCHPAQLCTSPKFACGADATFASGPQHSAKAFTRHRNLMAKQDLKELGFRTEQQPTAAQTSSSDINADKQKQGFIAGMRR